MKFKAKSRKTREQKSPKRPQGRTVNIPPEMERWMTAMHEAAHAVTAHALGIRPGDITIDAEEASRTDPTLSGVASHEIGTYRENAIIAIAGYAETARHEERFKIKMTFDTGGGEHNDIQHCKAFLVRAAGGNIPRAKAMMEGVIQEAGEIAERRSDAMNKVGNALIKAGRLTEDQIMAILGPLPTVSPEILAEREAVKQCLCGETVTP